MSAIHLSGSEFHPPTDGSVRWRGLESHGLPVGGLDVLKREVRHKFSYNSQDCYQRGP